MCHAVCHCYRTSWQNDVVYKYEQSNLFLTQCECRLQYARSQIHVTSMYKVNRIMVEDDMYIHLGKVYIIKCQEIG